jgi:ubiquinone/menaquinone biosynthesis C-methylase UbiE
MLDRVNLGCGPNAPSGWLNVDGSWNARLSNHPYLRKALETIGVIGANQGAQWRVKPLVHDLTKPLPFPSNSVSAIYGSHVLEHLYREDGQELLLECKRVLKPGGLIRLVVPDVQAMVLDYLERKNGSSTAAERAAAADRLNERLGYRVSTAPDGNFIFKFYSIWKDFHSHKWMYDSESLAHYVSLAGFQSVQRMEFRKSDIHGIEEVEVAERVLGGAGVCIEAKKVQAE